MPLLPIAAMVAVVVGLLAMIGSGGVPSSGAPHDRAAGGALANVAQAGIQAPAEQRIAQATAPAAPAPAAKSAFSPEQRRAIEQIIKEYLIANPEVMAEVQAAFEQKQAAMQAEQMKKAMTEHAGKIFRSTTAPTIGNPKGDITVVEFFDYNCGYCKRALGDIARLVETDKRVKVVLKELPIFGRDSEAAARVAMAAKKQGKYWEVHRALLEHKGKIDEAKALELAQKAGANLEQVKKEMASPEVKKEIERVKDLAEKMGIQGTPHFFVADRVIPGAPDDLFDILTRHIAEVRKTGGCKVC
jgi:protein-disulfide isomerase